MKPVIEYTVDIIFQKDAGYYAATIASFADEVELTCRIFTSATMVEIFAMLYEFCLGEQLRIDELPEFPPRPTENAAFQLRLPGDDI